jgi:hypothetical protein
MRIAFRAIGGILGEHECVCELAMTFEGIVDDANRAIADALGHTLGWTGVRVEGFRV